jgi:hypothetical protein
VGAASEVAARARVGGESWASHAGRVALALAVIAAIAGCAALPAPVASPATSAAAAAPAPVATTSSAALFVLVNSGFEATAMTNGGDPEGWYSFQHAGDKSYRFIVDGDQPRSGQRSLRIENVGPEPYGAIAQIVDARPHAGKVARLTGWLRTRGADDGGAGLTLLTLASGATVDQNFMYDAAVRGTTGWQRFTITVPVKKGADRLEVGAMLRGKGTLWLDDVELTFVAAQ